MHSGAGLHGCAGLSAFSSSVLTSLGPPLMAFFLLPCRWLAERPVPGLSAQGVEELPCKGCLWRPSEVAPDGSVTRKAPLERQPKETPAPRPAGVTCGLLQLIKQIKRGQRWRETTAVYLRGPCSLPESLYRGLLAAEGVQPVPALGWAVQKPAWCFVDPAVASEGPCGDSSSPRGSSVLCFAGCTHLGGAGRVTAEAVSAQQSLLLPFFFIP